MAFRDRVRSALSALTKDRQPGAVLYNTMAESMPGVVVTDDAAMRFAAVHACIRVLSEDIASLPVHLYQRGKEAGKERLRSHPLYELVHDRPNPEMTAFTFKECMMVNALMTGNAYAFIEFNQAGQVIALWPLLSDAARSGATWDITEVMVSASWSGDYQQAARKLDVTLLWSDTDPDFPREVIGGIDNGEMLFLYDDDGEELFRGYVFSLGKNLGATERTYTAYDGLIYLLKSSIAQNFQKTTAQGVTRQVAAELGLTVGTLPDDAGVALSFAHIAKPAYEAIMGAWTHVKKASDKMYLPVMKAGLLGVIVMGETVADRILTPSTDLVAGEVTSSIDDAVTHVLVVDKKGKTLATAEDAEDRALYGLLQAAVQKEDGLEADAQAKEKLKGADEQISLSDIIGGPDALDMVTGNAILVEEPSTGLHGKFHIINDTHTFSDGLHKVALGLDFEGMMDAVEVELIKAKKKSGKPPPPPDPWRRWAIYGRDGKEIGRINPKTGRADYIQ